MEYCIRDTDMKRNILISLISIVFCTTLYTALQIQNLDELLRGVARKRMRSPIFNNCTHDNIATVNIQYQQLQSRSNAQFVNIIILLC